MSSVTSSRAFAVALSLALSTLVFAAGAATQPENARPQPSARDLLQERVKVLVEISEHLRAGYQSGEVRFESMLSAEADVLSARLELAETAAERIALLEKMVENARTLEQLAGSHHEAGHGTRIDLLKAKALRLRAEADLVRARSADQQ